MKMNKVFIVEDDAVIARAVAAHLTTWQMQVQCAGNFEKITENWRIFNRTLLSWISNFRIIMDFTGVRKSVKRPKYRSFSYLLRTIT